MSSRIHHAGSEGQPINPRRMIQSGWSLPQPPAGPGMREGAWGTQSGHTALQSRTRHSQPTLHSFIHSKTTCQGRPDCWSGWDSAGEGEMCRQVSLTCGLCRVQYGTSIFTAARREALALQGPGQGRDMKEASPGPRVGSGRGTRHRATRRAQCSEPLAVNWHTSRSGLCHSEL